MKTLGIIFCIIFILTFLFAKIKVNGSTDITILQRIELCLLFSLGFTVILGLPILGVIYLIKF